MFNLFSQNKNTITVDEVKKAIDQKVNFILVDVRTQEEYKQGHLEGSVLVTLQELEEKLNKIPDKEKKYYVYCRSGGRSSQAVNLLQQLGYKDVHNMIGGILAWENKGYKVVK